MPFFCDRLSGIHYYIFITEGDLNGTIGAWHCYCTITVSTKIKEK